MRSSKLIDGVVWDGKDPAKYADGFKVKIRAAAAAPAQQPGDRWSCRVPPRCAAILQVNYWSTGKNHPAGGPAKEKMMENTAAPAVRQRRHALCRIFQCARSTGVACRRVLAACSCWSASGPCHEAQGGDIPHPGGHLDAAAVLFADPFYDNGPNDQGIGWNVLASLSASVSASVWRRWSAFRWVSCHRPFCLPEPMISPLISLLRPVSPLAWLPIGLLVFQKADPARSGRSSSARSGRWSSTPPWACSGAAGLPERGPRAQPASGRSSPRSCFRPCCPTC
jgi:hypothetical protein